MPAILVWLLFYLFHGYYDIFLSYRAVGRYKMSGSRCQITLNWCAMLPSDGEAGPVVQVHRRSKAWVQEFTPPPPAVESGVLDFLSAIIGLWRRWLPSCSPALTFCDSDWLLFPYTPTYTYSIGSKGVQLNIYFKKIVIAFQIHLLFRWLWKWSTSGFVLVLTKFHS